MRINDVRGWPPSKYDSAVQAHETCGNDRPEVFTLKAATFINGHTGESPGGTLLLTVVDSRTGEECTARLRIVDSDLGRRMAHVLGISKGIPLMQAGSLEISDN